MEEFTRMEASGIYPLHFHHQANGGRISNLSTCATGHYINYRCILVSYSKFLSCLLGTLSGILSQLKYLVKAINHSLISVIALGLLQYLQSQSHNITHFFQLSCIICLKTMYDSVISVFCQRGICDMGNADYYRTCCLSHSIGLNSLWCSTAQRGSNNYSSISQPIRSIHIKLISCVMRYSQLFASISKEVLSWIKL